MTTDGDTMAEDVALRLRALAATRWVDRSDTATREALLAGADEVERLTRQCAGDGDLTTRLSAEVGGYVDRDKAQRAEVERLRGLLDTRTTADGALLDRALSREASLRLELDAAQALARGAQYREREALAVVAVLRARLDGAAEWDALHDVLAASIGSLDGVGDAGGLAGRGRREAGPVTRRRWRQCSRCGWCGWLADAEAVPVHVAADGPQGWRACGWAVTVGEGSEGR